MDSFKEQLDQEEIDEELYNKIIDFMLIIDTESLTEDAQDLYHEIMDDLFDDEIGMDPEEVDNYTETELKEFTKLKKRISPAEKAKRKRLYRKNKAKLKIAGKKRRKTASFKRYKKKAKRMGKKGRTSSGKRQTTRI